MLSQASMLQTMPTRMAPLRNKRDKNKILIHEIYASIQGESSFMGLPCVFVRTTGCHLRCSYCDTEHAFYDGQEMSIAAVMERVSSFGITCVEVTGGEPLLQACSFTLLDKLVDAGFTVLIETSGAVSIERVNRAVRVILDIKTPSSLETKKMVWHNLAIIWPGCEVKFVVCDREDYDFAKKICKEYNLFDKAHVLFSPVVEKLAPQTLAEWMLADTIPARFQLQLHRILWGEASGK